MSGSSHILRWWDNDYSLEEVWNVSNERVEGELEWRVRSSQDIISIYHTLLCKSSKLTTYINVDSLIHTSWFTNLQVAEGELNNYNLSHNWYYFFQYSFIWRDLIFPWYLLGTVIMYTNCSTFFRDY